MNQNYNLPATSSQASPDPLTKEVAKKLMEIKGEARGVALKVDMSFLLKEKGEEDLKKLEEELEKLGYPLKYQEINTGAFYPIGLDVLIMLIIWKYFNFEEEKLKEMGDTAPKFSFFLKLFMRYFVSLQRVLEEVPKIWRTHYTIGDLRIGELNEKEKYVILRLENFKVHPLYCPVLRGYFSSIAKMVLKKETICQERKCSFRGDKYHEFLIKWS